MSIKFSLLLNKSNKIFSECGHNKFGAISVCQVRISPTQIRRSNAPSSARLHGKPSGLVDENFPCWPAIEKNHPWELAV